MQVVLAHTDILGKLEKIHCILMQACGIIVGQGSTFGALISGSPAELYYKQITYRQCYACSSHTVGLC